MRIDFPVDAQEVFGQHVNVAGQDFFSGAEVIGVVLVRDVLHVRGEVQFAGWSHEGEDTVDRALQRLADLLERYLPGVGLDRKMAHLRGRVID